MSFTENELQLVAKVQVLANSRKKVQIKVNAKRASLDKHVATVKRSSDALAKESNLLHEIDLSLSKLKQELLASFKQSEEISAKPSSKKNTTLSHYELGRED
jgi:hypothetical protein